MKEGKGKRVAVGAAAAQVAAASEREKIVLDALLKKPLPTSAIRPLVGMKSDATAKALLGRMKTKGLIELMRFGLPIPMWIHPEAKERLMAEAEEERKQKEKLKRQRTNLRYRLKKIGMGLDDDMPVRQLIVSQWRPAVKRGVSSVFELGAM